MKKVPVKYMCIAVEMGYVMAISRFNDFYNSEDMFPDDIKVNPKWLCFQDSVHRHINSSLSLNFDEKVWDKYKEDLITLSKESADKVCSVVNKSISIGAFS